MLLLEEQQGLWHRRDKGAHLTGTEVQPPRLQVWNPVLCSPEEGEAGSEQNVEEKKQAQGGWETRAGSALGTLPCRAGGHGKPQPTCHHHTLGSWVAALAAY